MLLWCWPDDTEVNSHPVFPTQSKFSSSVEREGAARQIGSLSRSIKTNKQKMYFLSEETENYFQQEMVHSIVLTGDFDLKIWHFGFTCVGPPRYGWDDVFKETGKTPVILKALTLKLTNMQHLSYFCRNSFFCNCKFIRPVIGTKFDFEIRLQGLVFQKLLGLFCSPQSPSTVWSEMWMQLLGWL